MGRLGQWMRKMKLASRLTVAHIRQNRMIPRQRRFNFLTMYPPQEGVGPPGGLCSGATPPPV
uniref:Uncharacterized protein n=1 Tax=Labrus bergylta TaxID=56723 RepID=A0A3Q3GDR3_9LABR